MPTLEANLAKIRLLLDEPSRPENHVLFELLYNNVQHHVTQLQNSSAHWSVYDFPLTAVAGQEDYLIAAPDFGKPFWVYTEDPNDPYRPRIEIPFAMLNNADQFYLGPRQVMSTSDNTPTAVVMSFYKKLNNQIGNAWYVRITPCPGGTAYYRLWYETLPEPQESLGATPGLTPFHHLIRVQTALSALPVAAWGDIAADTLDPKKAAAWERKSKALAIARSHEEQMYQEQFSTYLGNMMEAGIESRSPFGEGYDEWDYGYGTFGPNSL